MPEDVTVDRAALAAVMDAAGLGELSEVLAPPAVWRPPDEHPATLDAAWRELRRAGLSAHERLDEPCQTWLRVLAAPAEERFAWVSTPDEPPTVLLAAARNEHAMLAALTGERLLLRRIEPDELDDALLDGLLHRLPDTPPGAAEMRLPLGAAEPVEDTLFTGRTSEFETFAARQPLGLCELYAACTPALGSRRATTVPVWVRDAAEGRYLLRCNPDEAVAEPGDRARLLRALREARHVLG